MANEIPLPGVDIAANAINAAAASNWASATYARTDQGASDAAQAKSAAQSAAVRLIGQRPPTIFGASDTFALEMQDLLNETAADIAQYQDWRKMILRATINGDGTTTAFPFPPDFKQMILTGEMHPSMWPTWRHQQIVDLDR